MGIGYFCVGVSVSQNRHIAIFCPVPEYLHPQWEKWRQEIVELEKLEIRRCFKPDNFGPVKAVEMHYFSDASGGLRSMLLSETD